MNLLDALAFSPEALGKAVAYAVVEHPATAECLPATEGSALERLLARLKACSKDPESLTAFGARVTRREHRGLISSFLLDDGDLRERLYGALKDHLRESSAGPLWAAWKKLPKDPLLTELMTLVAGDVGLGTSMSRRWCAEALLWFAGDSPIQAIVNWIDAKDIRVDEVLRLEESPFGNGRPLIDALWRYLLVEGSGEQLLRETPTVLFEKGFALGSEDCKEFAKNYLVKVEPVRWDPTIRDQIKSLYGLPDSRESRPDFWDRVPDHIKVEFRTIYIGRVLKVALGGDHERHIFWRRWVQSIRDIETGVAGETRYAILEFRTFAVVEFFRKGNAAYFYDLEFIDRIRRVRPRDPSHLKVKLGPVTSWSYDNRLIHNGLWQPKAHRMVVELLGRM